MKKIILEKKYLYVFVFSLFLIPSFIFRDFRLENEVKYISIVTESLKGNNLFTFYNHGIVYADKPPLYFWIIMLVRSISGSYSILGIGLFSLIPATVNIIIMMKLTENELNYKNQFLASGMLMSTAFYIAGSIILRMDMLMTTFILLALKSFYDMYTSNMGKNEKYYFVLYIFLAVFTKGPMGAIYPILTITFFLLREKNIKFFRKMFSVKSLLLLIALFLLWFLMVFVEGGKSYLYNLTIKQTVGRGINAFHHKEAFYYYLKNMWGAFFPWSFLYFLTFIIGLFSKRKETLIEKFLSSYILIGFIFLSSISAKLVIYMLPIFPAVTFYSIMALKRIKANYIWRIALIIPAAILIFFFPLSVKFFNEKYKFDFFEYSFLIFDFIVGIISVYFIMKNRFKKTCYLLTSCILITVFFISFNFYKYDARISLKDLCENAERYEDFETNYYSFNFKLAENLDVYLSKSVHNIRVLELLENKLEKEKIILFIRNKDIRKNEHLRKILKLHTEIEQTEYYSVYKS